MKSEHNFPFVFIITFFFLFSTLLPSTESLATTLVIIKTTGKNCTAEDGNSFCGENAFCDSNGSGGRCTCNLGYRMTPNQNQNQNDPTELHCTAYRCTQTSECRQQFNRSVCWLGGGTCLCETSYWWDPIEGCRAIRAAPGEDCYANVDCGLDAYCDQGGGGEEDDEISTGSTCRCVPGAQPRDPGNVNCRPVRCDPAKKTKKTCPAGSVCDEDKRRCLPDGSVQLGDIPCATDEDCQVVFKGGSKKGGRCLLLSSPVASGNRTRGFCLRGKGDRGELSKVLVFTLAAALVFVKKI